MWFEDWRELLKRKGGRRVNAFVGWGLVPDRRRARCESSSNVKELERGCQNISYSSSLYHFEFPPFPSLSPFVRNPPLLKAAAGALIIFLRNVA